MIRRYRHQADALSHPHPVCTINVTPTLSSQAELANADEDFRDFGFVNLAGLAPIAEAGDDAGAQLDGLAEAVAGPRLSFLTPAGQAELRSVRGASGAGLGGHGSGLHLSGVPEGLEPPEDAPVDEGEPRGIDLATLSLEAQLPADTDDLDHEAQLAASSS